MPRRVSLPGADELFRRTRFPPTQAGPDNDVASDEADAIAIDSPAQPRSAPDADTTRTTTGSTKPSGRVRHDEKITIYVTADELFALEHTRLTMRAQHGVAVDRGRIVREAIHLALQDVAEHGDESALVRRLREQ